MKFIVQRDVAPVQMSDERFYLILVSMLAVVAAAAATCLGLILERNFLTIACDTAVLQSGIVNTIHGHWFANNGPGGENILGSHTTFLLLLFVPLYVIHPSVELLFTLQICGVYSTVIPIYLVALDLLKRPLLAVGLAAGALVSPLLLHMAVAPFHLETWIVAAAFWAYHFYLRGSLPGFCVSLLFAVCCGEQAALIFVALGAALLLVRDGLAWRRLYGLISIAAGVGWILLAVWVVEPIARGSHTFNIFAYNYTQWNIHSVAELPGAVAHQPKMACAYMINLPRWRHVAEIVGLPLLAAFFSWRSLILLAPFPLYFLMCDQEFFLYFHAYYYSFAFFAGYMGLMLFLAGRTATDRFGNSLTAVVILLNAILLCCVASYYIGLTNARDDAFTALLRQQFAAIPVEATVYAPHRYSAYLSNRDNLVIGDVKDQPFDFDQMLNARFGVTNIHPGQVDYIVVDGITDQCGFRMGGYDPKATESRSENVNALMQTGAWKMEFDQNNVVILHRIRK